MEINEGDFVKIIDGSYAVRVDQFEEFTSIGLDKELFKVIRINYNTLNYFLSRTTPVHNVFIKSTKTNAIYLHTLAFVRKVKVCKYCFNNLED